MEAGGRKFGLVGLTESWQIESEDGEKLGTWQMPRPRLSASATEPFATVAAYPSWNLHQGYKTWQRLGKG